MNSEPSVTVSSPSVVVFFSVGASVKLSNCPPRRISSAAFVVPPLRGVAYSLSTLPPSIVRRMRSAVPDAPRVTLLLMYTSPDSRASVVPVPLVVLSRICVKVPPARSTRTDSQRAVRKPQ